MTALRTAPVLLAVAVAVTVAELLEFPPLGVRVSQDALLLALHGALLVAFGITLKVRELLSCGNVNVGVLTNSAPSGSMPTMTAMPSFKV